MLFGKPTKHVRHVNEQTLTIGPQRYQVHKFWFYNDNGATRTDGLDLLDAKQCPLGSIISNHKMEILISPETIEPQQIYMGRIKLSFHDVFSHAICGGRFTQASFEDTSTENFTGKTDPITFEAFPKLSATDAVTLVSCTEAVDREFGTAGTGKGIKEFMLDDHISHFLTMKKVTVFDQRPLMGERFQRVPSKVKRINEGTFYALVLFNDSIRGGTPADTQVTVNIKDTYNELAI